MQPRNFVKTEDLMIYRSDNVGPVTNGTIDAPLSVSYRYFNFTGLSAHIVKRDGIEFDIKSQPSRSNSIIIQVIYEFGNNVELDPNKDYHNHSEKTAVGKYVMGLIEDHESDSKSRPRRRLMYQHEIDKDKLIGELGGSIYLADLDIVVSLIQDKSIIPKHPYGRQSERYRLLEAEPNINNVDRFGMAVYIISNDNAIQPHYINLNGNVFLVPVAKNNSLHNGVYLCRSSKNTADARYPKPDIIHYEDLEEACKELNLFTNYEDASANGDYFANKEKELKLALANAKENEFKFKKLESEMRAKELELKQEFERETAERKADFERESERRQHRLSDMEFFYKSRNMASKDHYEDMTYRRKDTSDFLKTLPVLITSAVAIGTLMYNLGNNK